jgi:MoxR-like ATPase
MPSDITGTEIIEENRSTGQREFRFLNGPLFANVILADEINRTPPKTQAALLEAMQERQVTVGRVRHKLGNPFFVLATQNPIEQEGTYPLPEAQLDRFLMHVRVDYPNAAAEAAILRLARDRAREALQQPSVPTRLLSQQQVFAARSAVLDLHLAPPLEEYIVQLVLATRDPAPYGAEIARYVAYGASPRGTIALDRCARAHAWLAGRDYVTPEDVHAIAPDVLRHRVLLGYEAEAEGIDADRLVAMLLERVPLP